MKRATGSMKYTSNITELQLQCSADCYCVFHEGFGFMCLLVSICFSLFIGCYRGLLPDFMLHAIINENNFSWV